MQNHSYETVLRLLVHFGANQTHFDFSNDLRLGTVQGNLEMAFSDFSKLTSSFVGLIRVLTTKSHFNL